MTRTTVRYGTRRGQVGELWLPPQASRPAGDLPVVVLIHGGFWRAPFTKVIMRRLARSVIGHGWAAWNIEYRRVGRFGGGGGWPNTFADVAAAVDVLADRDGLDLDCVVTCGHSAGGQLALWLAARPGLAGDAPGVPVKVTVRAAVALAGVVDLRQAYGLNPNGAVANLLGGSPDTVPDRYECASPIERLPMGVPQVLVHGLEDTVLPPAMSETYVARAVAAGDDAVYVPVPGATHRGLVAAGGPGWRATLEHLERLIGR